ncbi:amidohydrolase [Flavobacterium sp. M31R6]|uniref:amidohydrolase family protein n=1 Tax=Flavobacterium sp. M31R6 TaxID=2739062 RepID=UPI001568E4AE|nr:amidohydrolase family protein [Flavobacterium sp. M31R6]QKJ63432.1 amidohydrolase family protein [Flavobacterium sp. M31R6]
MKIDSHQHFWKFHPVKDSWINDDMKILQRDFFPPDLHSLLKENSIDGCVAVQADQSEEETHFLLELASANDWIKGVVGWIDLRSKNLEDRLQYFSQYKKLKGFRHIVQAEPEDDFLLRDDFCAGISKLAQYNLTYDLLIFPKHLPYAVELVKRFPQQSFVIDHLAKPDFKQFDFSLWEKGIREIANCPNVFCKVSGLVTEADWNNWKESDFTYCLDVVTEAFVMNRLLFGSDWPVSLLAASYEQSCGILVHYFSKFSTEQQDKFWGGNAIEFYNL